MCADEPSGGCGHVDRCKTEGWYQTNSCSEVGSFVVILSWAIFDLGVLFILKMMWRIEGKKEENTPIEIQEQDSSYLWACLFTNIKLQNSKFNWMSAVVIADIFFDSVAFK